MKYYIDKEHTRTLIFNGETKTLGRIVALRDVHNPHMLKSVAKGQQGGFVEICDDGSEILAQDGESWICKSCVVLKSCYVGGNALVSGGSGLMKNTRVINDGVIHGTLCEPENRVAVCGAATVENSVIFGDLNMMGNASIKGCQHKKGYVRMEDESQLTSCYIFADGHGIALKNKESLTAQCLKGEGLLGDERLKMVNLEKVK